MGQKTDAPPAGPPAQEALQDRATFLVGVIANRLVSTASAIYRRRFGIGFSEWRILVMLNLEPGIAAKRISEAVGLDKAAISRGLRGLEDQALIEATPETAGRRSQSYRLTPAGQALHDQVAPLAREQERLLLAGLEPEERRALVGLLQRLMARLPEIEAFGP